MSFLHFAGNFQALVHGALEKGAQTTVKKSKATDRLWLIVQMAALGSAASTDAHGCGMADSSLAVMYCALQTVLLSLN